MMPMRSGAIPHSEARRRISLMASRPSAAARGSTLSRAGSAGAGAFGPADSMIRAWTRFNSAVTFWNSSSVAPVSKRRYFSTKAATRIAEPFGNVQALRFPGEESKSSARTHNHRSSIGHRGIGQEQGERGRHHIPNHLLPAAARVLDFFLFPVSDPGAGPGHTGMTRCWAWSVNVAAHPRSRINQRLSPLKRVGFIGFSLKPNGSVGQYNIVMPLLRAACRAKQASEKRRKLSS